jgi:hypothetical protein
MDEHRQREDRPAVPTEAELKRPDEAIEDLEPDEREGEAVKGGYWPQKPDGSL